jgi:serine/threonine protein kinase
VTERGEARSVSRQETKSSIFLRKLRFALLVSLRSATFYEILVAIILVILPARVKSLLCFISVLFLQIIFQANGAPGQGYTKSCDWWSVGVILFEMIIGQPPFAAQTPLQTQEMILAVSVCYQFSLNYRFLFSIPIHSKYRTLVLARGRAPLCNLGLSEKKIDSRFELEITF